MTTTKKDSLRARRDWPKIEKARIKGPSFGSRTVRDVLQDDATGVVWLYKEEGWLGRLDKRGPDECWDWNGANHRQGYGLYVIQRIGDSAGSGPMNAQRFAMARHLGRPLKKDERVSATCHNHRCTNPDHLFITDYKGQFKNSNLKGQNPNAGLKRKKYFPDFFEAHFNDLASLGPLTLSKKLSMTMGEASAAKYAFNLWLKENAREKPTKLDLLCTPEFFIQNMDEFISLNTTKLAEHLGCSYVKARILRERFNQWVINGAST